LVQVKFVRLRRNMKSECSHKRRVVVNATPLLGNLTGVGRVTAEIAKRLDRDGCFETEFYTALKTFGSYDEIRSRSAGLFFLRAVKAVFRRIPFKQSLRDVASRIGHPGEAYDLCWEPNFIPLETIRARRVVSTVHDMSFHEHPEWHPADRVGFFSRNFFNRIEQSDVVVTVSEFSRERFLAACPSFPADRVRVIPCGINHDCFRVLDAPRVEAFRHSHRLPDSFVLFVGSIEPRKNIETLLAAYERLSPERREACPLVLAGDTGWKNREIHRQIRRLGRGVRTFGYLKRPEELALMYNAATIFVYPSLYEGFGIPPLEAMACGTPVCLSSIPVFHEIYGSETASYVDPNDPEALAQSLEELMSNEPARTKSVQAGLQLAKRYTWDMAYEQYHELFRELVP